MPSGMIAFAAGVIALGFSPTLPALNMLLGFLVCTVIACLTAKRKSNCLHALSVFLLLFGIGLLWHAFHAHYRLQQQLPLENEGVDFTVRGYVANLPERNEVSQRFRFYIESASESFEDRQILLNYYGSESIEAAQYWQFRVRLNRPRGLANPGTFDYEAWLLQQGIAGKGYVRNSSQNQRIEKSSFSVLAVRAKLRERIRSVGEDLSHQALILALAMGDRSLISDRQWRLFSRSGTNHLMVVSGLHVGFVASLCYLLGRRLWRFSTVLMNLLPAQKAGALSALTGACLYSLLAGFSLPTQRALAMVSVFMLGHLLAQKQAVSFSFLLALTVVLILDPFAGLAAGFWLSFAAVGGLLLVFAGEQTVTRKSIISIMWSKWGKAQFVVLIALVMPLSQWVGEVTLLSPVANLFAIPLVSIVVVPMCLLAVALIFPLPGMALVLLSWVDYLLAMLIKLLEFIAFNAPGELILQPALHSFTVTLFGIAGCLFLLLPSVGKAKMVGLILLLPLLFPRIEIRNTDRLELYAVDVGQGLAVIIRTANHVLVYDTGAGYVDGFDSGSQLVEPVLRSLGVQQIDTLVISHGDNDHAGGAAGLMSEMKVGRLLGSEQEISTPRNPETCVAGDQWQWDKVQFEFLHPRPESGLTGNNGSCVLHIRMGDHAILLPGDIEARVENELVSSHGEALKANILVAAHHGSNTSSTSRFVSAVDPDIVIFSSGYRNQFRHPAERVQERFSQAGVEQLFTSVSGMLSIYLDKGSTRARIERFRSPRRRYWN